MFSSISEVLPAKRETACSSSEAVYSKSKVVSSIQESVSSISEAAISIDKVCTLRDVLFLVIIVVALNYFVSQTKSKTGTSKL